MTEELKDKWNGEIEIAVRRLQTTDWDEVRSRWERRIGNVFQKVGEIDAGKEVAAANDRLKDTVAAAADGAKDAARNIKDNVIGAGEEAKDTVKGAKKKTTGKRLLEI